MVIDKDFKINLKKKIIVILACFGLVAGNVAVTHVEASAAAGAVSMGFASSAAAAGMGTTAVAMAPYVAIAVAIVGTGVVIYNSQDEIVAIAQKLYRESSSVMKSLIERAYDVRDNTLIMTSAIRNFVVSSAENLISIFNSPKPTIVATLMDPSYGSIPALYDKIPLEDMRAAHTDGVYSGYMAFTLGSKIYYITGLKGNTSLVSDVIYGVQSKKVTMKFLNVNNLKAERSGTRVYLDVYEYDTVSNTYTKHETIGGGTYSNTTVEFEDGFSLTIGVPLGSAATKDEAKIGAMTLYGLEGVLGVDDYLDPEDLNALVLSNGFTMTGEVRTVLGDYTPGKTKEVAVGNLLVNPGLNAKEIEDNLNVAFPTTSGSIALDMDGIITGVGADDLSDVMLDTGVVDTPKEVIGVKPGELAQSKTSITTAITGALPSVFPMAATALAGLKNVREKPPVININLNEIFTASTKEISPGLDSPFEEGESVFFDFSDLNKYRFGGKPLIEYIRMIIGFGFIFSTFLYIWKKFTVTTT